MYMAEIEWCVVCVPLDMDLTVAGKYQEGAAGRRATIRATTIAASTLLVSAAAPYTVVHDPSSNDKLHKILK